MGPRNSTIFSNFESKLPLRKLRNLNLSLTRRPRSSQIFLTGLDPSMLASMCLRTLIWKRSQQKLGKELWEACLLWEDSEGGRNIFISSHIWLLISSCYLQGLLHSHVYSLNIWGDDLNNPSTIPKEVPPSAIVVSLSCNTFFKFLFVVRILCPLYPDSLLYPECGHVVVDRAAISAGV
jgi:hypothetical protein